MAKDRGKSSLGTLFWRLSLAVSLAVMIAVSVLLWMSGERETKDAFDAGRRLLITLQTGEIKGNQAVIAKAATKELPADVGKANSEESDAEGDEQAADNVVSVPLAELNQGLMEKVEEELLPKIGDDGIKPWQYYAKPYERKGSLPMVAIIVTDLGQQQEITDSALHLPEEVGLSISSYARSAASWVTAARRNGHEVFLDIPLEPANYPASDPGPQALMSSASVEENEKKLHWILSRGQGYVGVIMPRNDGFSAKDDTFKALLKSLTHRGLMMVASREPAKVETKQIIETSNIATVTADALLDEELTPSAIQASLTALEQQARVRGYAVGMVRAYPITIEQLNIWTARLKSRGITLVPVSFIAKLRFS